MMDLLETLMEVSDIDRVRVSFERTPGDLIFLPQVFRVEFSGHT